MVEPLVSAIYDKRFAIAAWAGEASLLRCIESLQPQCDNIEVVAAVNGATTAARAWFPSVRFVEAPKDAT